MEQAEEDLGAALAVLRSALELDQAEVARAAGVPASSISEYERGRKVPSGRSLDRIVSGLALTPGILDAALDFVRFVQASQGGNRSAADATVTRFGSATARFARSALELCAPARAGTVARPIVEERLQAPALWERLYRYGVQERRAILRETLAFRSWALCELLCEKSVEAAADSPERAMELAETALLIAGLVPGGERWRAQVEGYAWAFLGNARRVGGDLRGADEAFARSAELWRALSNTGDRSNDAREDDESEARRHDELALLATRLSQKVGALADELEKAVGDWKFDL